MSVRNHRAFQTKRKIENLTSRCSCPPGLSSRKGLCRRGKSWYLAYDSGRQLNSMLCAAIFRPIRMFSRSRWRAVCTVRNVGLRVRLTPRPCE